MRGMRTVALALLFLPLPAFADQTIPISGSVPMGGPDRFLVSFTVPDGISEIEIAHTHASPDNILDWGLYDQEGKFRGYGGGNVENAITGALAASRSYLIGPIKAGTWQIEIGKAKMLTWPETYTITVTLRTPATLAPQPLRTP